MNVIIWTGYKVETTNDKNHSSNIYANTRDEAVSMWKQLRTSGHKRVEVYEVTEMIPQVVWNTLDGKPATTF